MEKLTIEQVKEFILWAKTQDIATLTVGDVSVTFFPAQPTLSDYNLDSIPQDQLLFHSSEEHQ